MCRDLNGRRLAGVKEEEKLKRWIEKKEQREKEKQLKKQEKLERLRRGPGKHEFKDQKYLEARDRILDQTEDAIEAGMRELEKKTGGKSAYLKDDEKLSSTDSEDSSSDDSSDSDVGIYDNQRWVPTTSATSAKTDGPVIRKRKQKAEGSCVSKRTKFEYTSNVIFEYFIDEILEEVAGLTHAAAKKIADERQKLEKAVTVNSSDKDKTGHYEQIDLDKINTPMELCALGLEHLKHALIERGLKCGGSLDERAARLFSVKGLDKKEYPKKLQTNAI